VHPQAEQESIFKEIGQIWTVVVNLVVLACVVRATTKKSRQLFGANISAPPKKILATPMGLINSLDSYLTVLFTSAVSLGNVYNINFDNLRDSYLGRSGEVNKISDVTRVGVTRGGN